MLKKKRGSASRVSFVCLCKQSKAIQKDAAAVRRVREESVPSPAMQSHFSGDLVTQTTGPGSNYTVLANFNLPVDVRDMHGDRHSSSLQLALGAGPGQLHDFADPGDLDLDLWSREPSLIRDSSLLREPSYLEAEPVTDEAAENLQSWSSARTVVAGDNTDTRSMAQRPVFEDLTWQAYSVSQVYAPTEHDMLYAQKNGNLQSKSRQNKHTSVMPASKRCMPQQTDWNDGTLSRQPTILCIDPNISGGNGMFDYFQHQAQECYFFQHQAQPQEYNNALQYNNSVQYNKPVFVQQPCVEPMVPAAAIHRDTKRAIEVSEHCDVEATPSAKRQAGAVDREATRAAGSSERADLRTPLLACCKFTSKQTNEDCCGELIIVPHKRQHLACSCPSRHQWVWCSHCCTCQTPEKSTRGCSVAAHWFERDSFDTGARNHMNVHKQKK
jgi:hypothetical protein